LDVADWLVALWLAFTSELVVLLGVLEVADWLLVADWLAFTSELVLGAAAWLAVCELWLVVLCALMLLWSAVALLPPGGFVAAVVLLSAFGVAGGLPLVATSGVVCGFCVLFTALLV